MREYAERARRPQYLASSPILKPLVCAVGVVILLTSIAVDATAARSLTSAQSSHHAVVIIKQMHFEPQRITVASGDTIEWKNEDIFAHSVTSDDGSFDSGLIQPGSSWQTTVTKTGTIAYHCHPHPNMTAQVIVESPDEYARSVHGVPGEEQADGTLKWEPPTKPEQFHPILVNFTAALLPLALLSDVLGLVFRRVALHAAGFWMVLYAAAITPFTAVAGLWWKSEIGVSEHPGLIVVHQWLGVSLALLFVCLATWRSRSYRHDAPPSVAYLMLALLVVVALVYQGSLGGSMAFGH
jgi:plastocyanin/uncharacterized membrane protein